MAYFSFIKIWESEFDNIISKKDRKQDIAFNQIKHEVHDSYKKDEKRTTNFEPVKDKDVINKAYLHRRLSKIHGHITFLKEIYNEFNLLSDKQSIEENLNQRAVETTEQLFYEKRLFDSSSNVDEVPKIFFPTRRRVDLEEIK